jgi:subfamily B ATP-binding cassette protein MsbA
MNNKDLYLRLLRYVKPYSAVFAIALLGILLYAATEPAVPALIKPLLDGSFVAKDPTYITLMPLLLAGLFLVRGIASFIGVVAMQWVAHRVVMDLREALFNKLLLLPTQRFDNTPGGVLLSKLTYDVTQVMSASTQTVVTLVRDSVAVLGLLLWIFYLNWKLALIAFLVAPSIVLVMRLVSQRLRRLSGELQTVMGELNRLIHEAIQGHRVIKMHGAQTYEAQRFQRTNNWVRRYNVKLAVASQASVPIVQFLAVAGLATVIYIASLQSAADKITVGGFVSLFGAMAMLLSPLKRLTKINEPLQRGLAAAESIFALLDEPAERDQGTHTLGRVQGRVRFQDVSLQYRTNEENVLQQLNFEVQPGETIAIVGPSGSGKTSLVGLIPRFYDPTQGRILLDGIDTTSLQLADLRANIAYVGQNIVLFNDTLAANISYGAQAEVSKAAIERAAEGAYALEFIQAFPEGLDTLIGENGMRLSGGQRQRVAIARALLRNAPILILDEATSALDTQSERHVQQALEVLRQGRTAFIVAHRLSTIENADRIVVLQKGKIVELGTHRELLTRKSFYANLYHMQQDKAVNRYENI